MKDVLVMVESLTPSPALRIELSSEDEGDADEGLDSECTESVDEEESKLRVQSVANTKVAIRFEALMSTHP